MSDSIFTPKVSVIMPVYNTELYVERAVVSLMEQTLDDVQFIIIDDGSNDNSINIIKQVIARYPEREGQVTLLSRENRGVAATRAQGLDLATGEYVIHLDSDDWAEINWLEVMYLKAAKDNADIVICDYNIVFNKKSFHLKQKPGKDNLDCVSKLLIGKLHGSSCNKLVRRKLIFDNNLSFIKSINFLEDFIFIVQVLLSSEKVSYVGLPLINYNKMNESSITSHLSYKKIEDIMIAIQFVNETLTQNPQGQLFSEQLISQKLRLKYWMLDCARGDMRKYISSLYREEENKIWKIELPIHVKIVLYITSFDYLPLFFFKVTVRVINIVKRYIK
ncbi:glycosyltransferase family 2 protein [Vibrio anguillarum]|uniref:Glycosyltransferase family 2 protein n=1 Tax=Vibrio anguillarum TaxID=55601 RepID=A0ABD4QTH2_VIBAN|nr:glycosyltransferase family A protein [Vibrio anguillarum]MBT2918464.1 glycosyltransferase family 2 protein [Vibrio anguillarum]